MSKKQNILLILSTLLVLTILSAMIIPALAYTNEEERSETEVLPVEEELGDKLGDESVEEADGEENKEEANEGEDGEETDEEGAAEEETTDEVKDREETDEQGIVNEETTREEEDGEEADEEGAAEEGAANEEATDDDGIDEDADDEGKVGIEEEAAANKEMPEVILEEEGVVRLINTLNGSSFCLYTLDAVQVTEREYEDNGTVVFRDIAPGEYYLFEEQASAPYGTMYMIFVEKDATETIVDMAIYFNGW